MNSTSTSGRRMSFSLDEKRRVLEHLRVCGHVRETIDCFYPQLPLENYDARRRLVLNWRRNAQEIFAGASTRQGGARKRMRRPKTPKPKPPVPRGLEAEIPMQNEPFLNENEQEMKEFEPIVLKKSRKETQILQDPAQDEGILQDVAQDQDGGIQDLIATAVEQSTRRLEQVRPCPLLGEERDGAEEAEPNIDTGAGSGSEAEAEAEAEEEEKKSASSDEEEREETTTQRVVKRSSFSLDEKRRVLEHLATCKNVRKTIETFYPELPPEEFNTRRRTIWRWRKCTEQIVAGCADDKASARKKMRPRGIVCHRGLRHVEPQDVVDRLLTSVKKTETRTLKRKGNRMLRPAPPAGALLADRQVDAIVFSALGLPPTTQFPFIQPAPAIAGGTTVVAAATSTMRPLERGEAAFAIRRR